MLGVSRKLWLGLVYEFLSAVACIALFAFYVSSAPTVGAADNWALAAGALIGVAALCRHIWLKLGPERVERIAKKKAATPPTDGELADALESIDKVQRLVLKRLVKATEPMALLRHDSSVMALERARLIIDLDKDVPGETGRYVARNGVAEVVAPEYARSLEVARIDAADLPDGADKDVCAKVASMQLPARAVLASLAKDGPALLSRTDPAVQALVGAGLARELAHGPMGGTARYEAALGAAEALGVKRTAAEPAADRSATESETSD